MALSQYELKKYMNAIPVTKASQRSIYDEKKSFECNIFSTASDCRKQLSTDRRAFKCNICEKAFIFKDSMKHME